MRWKFGSSRSGAATSRCPRSESTGAILAEPTGSFTRGTGALYDGVVSVTSREIRLVARPQGVPDEDLFELVETEVPDPADGQILIRNAYLSVDPYMRGRMNDRRSYVAPFALGEAMTGGAVGRVAASRNADWPEGSWVLHSLGWREWALSDGGGLQPVDRSSLPCRPRSACSACRASPPGTASRSSGSRARARRCSSRRPQAPSAASRVRWPGCSAAG